MSSIHRAYAERQCTHVRHGAKTSAWYGNYTPKVRTAILVASLQQLPPYMYMCAGVERQPTKSSMKEAPRTQPHRMAACLYNHMPQAHQYIFDQINSGQLPCLLNLHSYRLEKIPARSHPNHLPQSSPIPPTSPTSAWRQRAEPSTPMPVPGSPAYRANNIRLAAMTSMPANMLSTTSRAPGSYLSAVGMSSLRLMHTIMPPTSPNTTA